MTEHLTPEQINQYRRGTLSPAEEEALEEHRAACAACHNALQQAVLHADVSLAQKLQPPQRRRWLEHRNRVARLFLHRYRPVLVPLAAAVAVVIALNPPASSGNTISQRKTLAEQVAQQISEVLEEAQPTLNASRAFIRTNPDTYGILRPAPPREEHWHARAEMLMRLLQTGPQFNRLYYGDRSGDFTAAERLPGGGFQVDHRTVIEDPARGTRRYDRSLYPVTGGEFDRIEWSHGRKVDSHTFDLRERPWYRAAQQSRSFAWTVYRFYETGRYGVTASLPLIEGSAVVGVFGIDLELSDLSSDLSRSIAQLGVLSQEARLFVLSDTGEQGLIIAQTRGMPPVMAPLGNAPPLARDSREPVVQEATAALATWSASRGSDRPDYVKEFDVAGHYVAAQRSRVESLPWTVLVAVPKRDIQRGAFPAYAVGTLGGCVAALLIVASLRSGKRHPAGYGESRLLSPDRSERKTVGRAVGIARLLLGLIFVGAGLNGFFLFLTPPRHSPAGGAFIDLLVFSGYMSVEKALEVIGGALLLRNRYVLLGLVILGPLVVNVLLFHLLLERKALLLMGVLPFLLWASLMWIYRRHYLVLFTDRAEP